MQSQKWANLGLLIGSGIVFFFFTKLVGLIWELSRLPLLEEWPIGPDLLIAFVLTAFIGIAVRRSATANQFFNEVAVELGKVSWPLRKETMASSGVVVVLVAIAAFLLTMMDLVWARIARGVLF